MTCGNHRPFDILSIHALPLPLLLATGARMECTVDLCTVYSTLDYDSVTQDQVLVFLVVLSPPVTALQHGLWEYT